MAPFLSVDVCRSPGTDRVSAAGELDVAGGAEFARVLTAAREAGHATEVDLGRLRFCDAAGAHVLRDAAAAAAAAGLGFAVTGVGGEVARLLGLLGLRLPGSVVATP